MLRFLIPSLILNLNQKKVKPPRISLYSRFSSLLMFMQYKWKFAKGHQSSAHYLLYFLLSEAPSSVHEVVVGEQNERVCWAVSSLSWCSPDALGALQECHLFPAPYQMNWSTLECPQLQGRPLCGQGGLPYWQYWLSPSLMHLWN